MFCKKLTTLGSSTGSSKKLNIPVETGVILPIDSSVVLSHEHTEKLARPQNRVDKYEQIKALKETQHLELAEAAAIGDAKNQHIREQRTQDIIAKNKRKQLNREAYKKRKQERLNKNSLRFEESKLTLQQRIIYYASWHDCDCKLKCNVISKHGSEFTFSCNHKSSQREHQPNFYINQDVSELESMKGFKSDFRCNRCSSKKEPSILRAKCDCYYLLCAQCKISNYFYEYDINNVHGRQSRVRQNFDKHVINADSNNNVHFTIESQDVKQFDLDTYQKNNIKSKFDPVGREKFLREIANEGKSYAERLKDTTPITEEKKLLNISRMTKAIKLIEQRGERKPTFHTLQPKTHLHVASVWNNYPIKPQLGDLGRPILLETFNPAKIIETIPEGGAMSALTAPISGAYEKIKEHLKNTCKDITRKIKSLIDKCMTNIALNFVKGRLQEFLLSFKHFTKIFFRYFAMINPLTIVELFIDAGTSFKSAARELIHLASIVRDLRKAEQESYLKFRSFMIRRGYDKTDLNFILTEDFGVLTPRIRSEYKYICKKYKGAALKQNLKDLLLKPQQWAFFLGDKYNWTGVGCSIDLKDDENTERGEVKFFDRVRAIWKKGTEMDPMNPFETEEDHIVIEPTETYLPQTIMSIPEGGMDFAALISSIFESFPARFGKGISILKDVIIASRPLLSGIKLMADVSKIAGKLIDVIIEKIFHNFTDPKKWLEYQISTPGNPINELVVLYVAYQHSTVSIIVDQLAAGNELRTELFTKFAEADSYALRCNKLSSIYMDFRNKMSSSLSTPPKPTAREYEPTTLVLSGAAGTGKSTIWPVVVCQELISPEKMLNKNTDVLKEVQDLTHTWNTSSEFQPGMSSKKLILFDDFKQDRENNEEALAVIHLCTNAPFPINSPNVQGPEIKGMTCSPEILVICTNVPVELAAQSLSDPQALKRRYDLEVEPLKRFNPQSPEEQIFKIKSCNKYAKLIGKAVNLSELRTIFSTIHRAKRDLFKQTRAMVDTFSKKDLLKMVQLPLAVSTLPSAQALWQGDENLEKDMRKYMMNGDIPFSKSTSGDLKNLVIKTKDKILGSSNPDLKVPIVPTMQQSGEYLASACSTASQLKLIFSNLITFGVTVGTPLLFTYSFLSTFNQVMTWSGSVLSGGVTAKQALKGILTPMVTCLLTTISVTGMLYMAYKFSGSESESGSTRTAKPARHALSVPTHPEGGEQDTISEIIKRATGTIKVKATGMTTNCLFIRGQYILIPRHIILDTNTKVLQEGTTMQLLKSTWNGSSREFRLEHSRFIPINGNIFKDVAGNKFREDILMYELDNKNFSAEKDIMGHFWEGEFSIQNMEVDKYDFIPWNSYGVYVGEFNVCSGKVLQDKTITPRQEGTEIVYHVVGLADYTSRASSCGSAVRLMRQEQPIIGIHIARTMDNKSAFHYVTRSALRKAIENRTIIDVVSHFSIMSIEEAGLNILPENSILEFHGKIDKPIFRPTKTDLQPSLLYEFITPATTAPAVLHGGDNRLEPEYKGVKFYRELFNGYTKPEGKFEWSDISLAVDTMKDQIRRIQAKSSVPTKVLNLCECINGIEGLAGNTRIEMSTSPGYPYVQQRLKKDDLFYEIDGALVPSERIQDDFDLTMKQIEDSRVPFLPFVLTLKDERVKHAKIIRPKTRIFACANVTHFLIMRKYFYTFLMQMYHADVKDSFCLPALDRLSLDWHEFSTHMLEVGEDGFDFDFKYWDRSLQKILLWAAVDIMLVGQKISKVEENILKEMVSSPTMIWGDNVFKSAGILMSGSLITYMLNCIVNELIHRAAYFALASKEHAHLATISSYLKYTRGIRGGDDTITTAHKMILEFFNGKTVGAYFIEHGMLVTAVDKSNNIPKSTPFLQLTFLKNKTQFRSGFFLPLPEADSLLESMYWVRLNKNNQDIIKATEDNATCSLRGFYFHGKSCYNYIREAAMVHCPSLNLPLYDELHGVWRKYFKFPGAHADYATRELQQDPFLAKVEPHKLRKYFKEWDDTTMNTSTYTHTTQESGAMDKEKLGSQDITTVSVTDPTSATPITAIENNNADDPGKTEQSRVGATIQDAPSTSLVAVTTGNTHIDSKNDRARAYLNDTPWDLAMLAQKFTFVKDVEWSIVDPVGTILSTLKIPQDILVTPAQKTPFDVTRLWKCTNVLMKVVFKASPFYAGSLGLGFMPFDESPTASQMIQMGALIQKVSQNEGLEFSIPFRFPLGYLNVEEATLGRFCIFVLSPLRTGPSNPNTVSASVYTAIEDSQFMIPEVIPTTAYYSRKFDKGVHIIRTIPESGMRQTSQICDINHPIQSMKMTTMCVGTGIVGSVKESHFQDSPSNFNQLAKRWIHSNTFKVPVPPGNYSRVIIPVAGLYVASNPFLNYYAAFRGGINVRVVILNKSDEKISGNVRYVTDNDNSYYTTNQGAHLFNESQIAQFTIPWTQRTFITTPQIGLTGNVQITFNNVSTASEDMLFEIWLSAADDFHVGIFKGGQGFVLNKVEPLGVITQPIPFTTITVAEAGVIEFIDRALETTLPLVEKVSKLGNLLDAHMITYQPYPITPHQLPYSIASDLPQYTERLVTTNHNGLSLPDKECFGAANDEADMYNLLHNTKSIYSHLTWNAIDAPGTVLGRFLAGPTVYEPYSLHENIPKLFEYWHGGTIYIFDVIATEMHRGQLLLTYTPNNVDDITYTDGTQTYFTTIDLSQGRGTYAVNLPYLSEYPYKRVLRAGGVETGETNGGKLMVFVQNPLRSTTTVDSSVDIVVYKSYASDFQLGVYGMPDVIGEDSSRSTQWQKILPKPQHKSPIIAEPRFSFFKKQ